MILTGAYDDLIRHLTNLRVVNQGGPAHLVIDVGNVHHEMYIVSKKIGHYTPQHVLSHIIPGRGYVCTTMLTVVDTRTSHAPYAMRHRQSDHNYTT